MAVARAAGDRFGAVGGTAARARRAGDGGVDLDVVRDAERRFGQLDVEPQQGILATLRARPWSAACVLAEEGIHDVVEVEALTAEPAASTVAERIAATVKCRALLRVRQHLVGDGDLLEPVGGVSGAVDIGMELARELAISFLDLISARVTSDAECCVVVLCHVS